MANYNVTKDYTMSKIKTEVKASAMDVIFAALVAEYGAENVAWVRTGNSSKTNEIAAIIGTADVDGQEVPVCFTVNASAKDFVDRKTDKKTFQAFDFVAAKEEFETYVVEKSDKEAAKAKAKADKIAKDEAARAKKKAEAEAKTSVEDNGF